MQYFYASSISHAISSQAYEICVKRDLLLEQVFILGRMGNSKQALAVIINKLGDIAEVPAILSMEFYLYFILILLVMG